ncbi:Protein kinase, putative [Hondaea fermentalgiana]|uniref:Cyclin-dependent kinase 2 homolog n=1 Tax=Hondaea fermentalgiana TaxID=2315210 RepID=A0A2R5GG25_9STRA|nr:Protein kinase, putative [Hondaea fermentalgiana]|eukprot:GBG27191.1 Protein kinase, putative [Hondaea fermentalgiana]
MQEGDRKRKAGGGSEAVLPEFKLLRRIGQGTFAQVFEAVAIDDTEELSSASRVAPGTAGAGAGAAIATDYAVAAATGAAAVAVSANYDQAGPAESPRGTKKQKENDGGHQAETVNESTNDSKKCEPQKVAIKRIRQDDGRGPGHSAKTLTQREVDTLRRMDHPNILKLLGVFDKQGRTHLVLPLCKWDLEAVLADRSVQLTLADVKTYAQGLLRGLAHCHERGILHRDVKPNNILVGNDGNIKLCDFGSAREVQTEPGKLTRQVVTQNYRSPELIFGLDPYDTQIDVWAAACVIGEMLRRDVLFDGRSDIDQLSKIFAVIGTPTESEWPTMRSMPFYFPFQVASGKGLASVLFIRENLAFGSTADEALAKQQTLALIGGMLKFDPSRRTTAHAAAQDVLFESPPLPSLVSGLVQPQTLEGAHGSSTGAFRVSSDGSMSSSSLSSWGE